MPISIEADPTLAQGYLKVNGVTAATVTSTGLTTASLQDAAVTQAKLASNVATTGPAFRAFANSATSVPHATNTRITLGGEDYDTANCFASSRFTPNVAGYYLICAGLRCESLQHGHAIIAKNGAPFSGGAHANAGMFNSTISDLVYLNGSTDYVELWGYHTAGTTQDMGTVSLGGLGTWLSGFLARAA